MESILAVEMQQRIEREYEVSLTTDEIKLISVGQIKEYQNGMKYLSSYISFTQNNTLF
jgi:hypothetical protein